MGPRIRPVMVTITVEAVIDDGNTLTPIPLQPIQIPATIFEQFDLGEQVAVLQAQLDSHALHGDGSGLTG